MECRVGPYKVIASAFPSYSPSLLDCFERSLGWSRFFFSYIQLLTKYVEWIFFMEKYGLWFERFKTWCLKIDGHLLLCFTIVGISIGDVLTIQNSGL